MSMFENDQYRWRETYFVLFESARRPKLTAILRRLGSLNNRFTMANPAANREGLFESLTVLSPDDFAALDVCYLAGEEVREQALELAKELRSGECTQAELAKLQRLKRCDGRFDVLHFEQILDSATDELDDMFDPSTLLIVLEALAELTGGIPVDPQAGALL
jgi:hypothetical protein